jgi:glycosyltransferase involved in cell wall biosynthesis
MQGTRKKILFVVPSLVGGGGQRVATTLCEALGKAKDLELVLVIFHNEASIPLGLPARVRHINVKESGGALYTINKFSKLVFNLAWIIRQEKPLAILSFMDFSNTVILLARALAGSRSRVVISVHTLFSAFLRGKGADVRGKLLRLLANLLYRRADQIVAVSRGAALDLIEIFNLPAEKIRVIGNPHDLAKIGRLNGDSVIESVFKEGIPIILFAGRLAPEKGGDILLHAFSLLRQKTHGKLVFLGEGQEKKKLVDLCRRLRVEKDVSFLGYQENPFKYMAHSTVFALPSIYEGCPMVLVEAMACGCPVVSTRCYDGIENIIDHGRTGLLVDVGDRRALADAMRTLLENPDLRASMAEAGRKKAEDFSVAKIAGEYRKVLLP